MKIAYLVSKYPAVSHTFVMREVAALRERGVFIGTFSVRRPTQADVLGEEAAAEAKRTRWLVWARPGDYARALLWGMTRPLRLLRTLVVAIAARGMSLKQRALWCCYFLEALVLAHWLSAEEYEHLHCHFGNSGSSTGLLAAKLAGVPFSLTCHGSELLHVSHYRLDYKAQQAAFVACVSYYGRALLMMACPPEFWPKLQVVRCGLPKAPPAKAPRPPKAKESILCVGRLSEEKGHLVLLDALARLRERGFQAECVLVGDGPMRGEVEARIARLRLADMVRLTGSLPSDRVAGLYHTASVVVLASFSEGVPVVLMEAMSAGCPVVATQVGGVGELVQDRLTGRLVAPGNAESLAEALEWVLTHPDETRVMVREARGLIEREFCQETAAGQLAGLFKCSRMLTGQDAPPAATKPAPCLVAQAAKPAGPSSLVL